MTSRAKTETEAANGSLALCYRRPVAALSDPIFRAREARRTFGDARDYVLVRRDWNFASRWDIPAKSPTAAPAGPFLNQFPLAADVLIVREVEGLGVNEWEVRRSSVVDEHGATIESKVLVTNASSVKVRSTVIKGPDAWDPAFLVLFNKVHASMMPQLHRDPARAGELRSEADAELDVASKVDAREAAPQRIRQDTSWLAARGGGFRR